MNKVIKYVGIPFLGACMTLAGYGYILEHGGIDNVISGKSQVCEKSYCITKKRGSFEYFDGRSKIDVHVSKLLILIAEDRGMGWRIPEMNDLVSQMANDLLKDLRSGRNISALDYYYTVKKSGGVEADINNFSDYSEGEKYQARINSSMPYIMKRTNRALIDFEQYKKITDKFGNYIFIGTRYDTLYYYAPFENKYMYVEKGARTYTDMIKVLGELNNFKGALDIMAEEYEELEAKWYSYEISTI